MLLYDDLSRDTREPLRFNVQPYLNLSCRSVCNLYVTQWSQKNLKIFIFLSQPFVSFRRHLLMPLELMDSFDFFVLFLNITQIVFDWNCQIHIWMTWEWVNFWVILDFAWTISLIKFFIHFLSNHHYCHRSNSEYTVYFFHNTFGMWIPPMTNFTKIIRRMSENRSAFTLSVTLTVKHAAPGKP